MSKSSKKAKKPTTFYADGEKMFFYRQKPLNDAIIDEYAKAYLDWGLNNEDALVLKDFPISIGMYPKSFQLLMKRHEGLREAHQVVKAAVASRREKGAIKRKFEPGMIKYMMPYYAEEWKEIGEWHAKLKEKEEDSKKQNITVVIDKMPDTDKVPTK